MPESTLARTQQYLLGPRTTWAPTFVAPTFVAPTFVAPTFVAPEEKLTMGKANRRERKQTKGPKLAIEESVIIRAIESSKEEHKVRKQSAKSKEHRC